MEGVIVKSSKYEARIQKKISISKNILVAYDEINNV